jgi:hypothetical protein
MHYNSLLRHVIEAHVVLLTCISRKICTQVFRPTTLIVTEIQGRGGIPLASTVCRILIYLNNNVCHL